MVAIIIVATVVRFGTLGVKSYWLDEGYTVQLLHLPFGRMLHVLSERQPNPPVYFVLAWMWARVAGYSEFALRSLSALAGVATIPVSYIAAQRLIGRRGAVFTAALLAVNPPLVWYSQEARPYALFVLLAALSLVFLARSIERPRLAATAAWGASCVLMLGTHYFAIFLITAEAGWLLWCVRARVRRSALLAFTTLPLLGILFVALEAQSGIASQATWGGESALGYRVISVPATFFAGFEAAQRKWFALLSALLVLVALAELIRRASASERRGAVIAASIGLATIGLPVVAAVLGRDYLAARNVIVALVPLWMVIGAALAAGPAGRLAALGLFGIGLAAVAVTAWTPKYHFQDWRNVAAAMARPSGARAVVVAPDTGTAALSVYLPGGLHRFRGWSPPVSEIDVIATVRLNDGQTHDPLPPDPGADPAVPAAGFRLVDVVRRRRFTLVRYTSRHPIPVTDSVARAADFVRQGPPSVVIEP